MKTFFKRFYSCWIALFCLSSFSTQLSITNSKKGQLRVTSKNTGQGKLLSKNCHATLTMQGNKRASLVVKFDGQNEMRHRGLSFEFVPGTVRSSGFCRFSGSRKKVFAEISCNEKELISVHANSRSAGWGGHLLWKCSNF